MWSSSLSLGARASHDEGSCDELVLFARIGTIVGFRIDLGRHHWTQECGSKIMYLVVSSTANRVESLCEYQVFRQLFMAWGKSETGHVSECNRGCLAATRTFRQPARVGSGGGDPTRSWQPAVKGCRRIPEQSLLHRCCHCCEKNSWSHQTTPWTLKWAIHYHTITINWNRHNYRTMFY